MNCFSSELVSFLLYALCTGLQAQLGFPGTGVDDPVCERGDSFIFPVPCFVCVNADGTDLCGVGEIDCQWGVDPVDPNCAVTEPPPPPPCKPEDSPPDFGIPGVEVCLSCLNVDTLQACTGAEGEMCTWRDCDDEKEEPSCQPGDSPPAMPTLPFPIPGIDIDECLSCLNVDTLQACTGTEGEMCTWRDCDDEIDVPVTTVPPTPDTICLECLNVETTETCTDVDGEKCDWFPCESFESVSDPSGNSTDGCNPGAKAPLPGLPEECFLKCLNEEGELCGNDDVNCQWENFLDLWECLNDDENDDDDPSPRTTPEPDPEGCSPGASLPLYVNCSFNCYDATGEAICSKGDIGCAWNFSPGCPERLRNISNPLLKDIFGIIDISTTPAPSQCQPGDNPPVPRHIACVLCVNENNSFCEPGQRCMWRKISNSPCTGCREPDICPQHEKPTNCRTCRCLNEDSCQPCQKDRDEKCSWHRDVGDCKQNTCGNRPFTPCGAVDPCREIGECESNRNLTCKVSECSSCQAVFYDENDEVQECKAMEKIGCEVPGRQSIVVGNTIDNPEDPCNLCVCQGNGELLCHNDRKCGQMKRLSLTFESDNCFHILNDTDRRQSFIDSLKQQIKSISGVYPKDMVITCGSIITDFTIVEEDQALDLDRITEEIKKQVENGNLTLEVDGQDYVSVTVTEIEVATTKPSPPRTPTPKPSISTTTVIIIAVVIAAFLLILVIAVTLCVMKSRRRSDDQEKQIKDAGIPLDGHYKQESTASQMKGGFANGSYDVVT